MGNQKPFTPKGEEVLRQEVVENYGFDEVEHEDLINKIVADRLKDEKMKASLHDSKEKKKETIAELTRKLEEAEKSKGTDEDKTKLKKELKQIVAEEQFIASGGSNTELRQLKKIMAATGKSFTEAKKDSLFVAFQEKQEREGISRLSQLPPSRGGTTTPTKEVDEIAKRNEGNLPPGFQVVKK